MSADNLDRQLKDLFSELNKNDAGHVPPFAGANGSVIKRRQVPLYWPGLAAAAAVLIVAGASLSIVNVGPCSTEARVASCSALSNWQASTDSLLSLSSTPWGSRVTLPSDGLGENLPVLETSQ